MAAKRARSENFTYDDKMHLLEIIESRKYIVETKKSNAQVLKAKDIAWVLITNDYNAVASCPRKLENLKTCWENLKKRYRTSIANESSDVKPRCLNESDKILHKKIGDILTSTQDKCQNSNDSNDLNTVDVDNSDHDDSQSCCSEDSLHSETKLKEYSEKWSRLKRIKDYEKTGNMESIESMEKEASCQSKTDAPCVLMLTSQDLNSDSETQNENNIKTFEFSPQIFRNGINLEMNDQLKTGKHSSKKQSKRIKDMNYALAEAKLELAKLSKEHALSEERRKVELHELQIQEAKLKIELMKLQLLKREAELFG